MGDALTGGAPEWPEDLYRIGLRCVNKEKVIRREKRMDEMQKLSVVIEHWIEHNQSHMGEYRKWAQRAGELSLEGVKAEIEEAVGMLTQSNRHLEKARKAIGNPS
jgi:hypothetical protein